HLPRAASSAGIGDVLPKSTFSWLRTGAHSRACSRFGCTERAPLLNSCAVPRIHSVRPAHRALQPVHPPTISTNGLDMVPQRHTDTAETFFRTCRLPRPIDRWLTLSRPACLAALKTTGATCARNTFS